MSLSPSCLASPAGFDPSGCCEAGHGAKLASTGFREEHRSRANEDIFHRVMPFLGVRPLDLSSCPWMLARTIILEPAAMIVA